MDSDLENVGDLDAPSGFGAWLKKTREDKQLSPKALSEKSGVSYVQIYNLESGRSQNPQERTRDRLTAALQETPSSEVIEATKGSSTIEDVGELQDFDPHDSNDWPDGPGVYVFYDISERVIYVGQSDKVSKRLNDHFTRFWFKDPIVRRAEYIRIDDPKLRKQIEKIMIKFLKSNAIINKHHVERGDVDD